jgi:hypothetical protein
LLLVVPSLLKWEKNKIIIIIVIGRWWFVFTFTGALFTTLQRINSQNEKKKEKKGNYLV